MPFPPPGDLPDLGLEYVSLISPALAGRVFFFFFFLSLMLPGKPYTHTYIYMCIHIYMYVHAKLLQSCLTLCDPMDCSPPGSSVRQEYWSGLPCSSPGDLPDPEIKPRSPVLQAVSLSSEPPEKPIYVYIHIHRFVF